MARRQTATSASVRDGVSVTRVVGWGLARRGGAEGSDEGVVGRKGGGEAMRGRRASGEASLIEWKKVYQGIFVRSAL